MSFLNRSEEATVPSCPPVGDNNWRCGATDCSYAEDVLDPSGAAHVSPALRRQITASAVVTLLPARGPKATLEKPLVLFASASRPAAILPLPAHFHQLPCLSCRWCC